MSERLRNFPFSAVAGQDQFKLALLLAAVNPLVGGVLVSGPRGSAKSTLAKGLANILPRNKEGEQPFVTLPLGASEEMLIGTLNLHRVLNEQEVEFQHGLLARAHAGVLYVDEVNLLPDNLVDQLLDVAASGVNTVERDGISHQHDARFILLGTMNPDEGELRPQLMDRFGLYVSLSNQYSIEERMQVVKLRERFDKDAAAFLADYESRQQQVMEKIAAARQALPGIQCDDSCRGLIAEKCAQAGVDGLRADIVWLQTALAHAGLQQGQTVTEGDVLAVEALVLDHRRNDETGPAKPPESFSRPMPTSPTESQSQQGGRQEGDWGAMKSEPQKQLLVDVAFSGMSGEMSSAFASSDRSDRRSVSNSSHGSAKGRGRPGDAGTKVNWFSTVIAAAGAERIERLQFHKRKRGETVIHLVMLDTSASILKNQAFGKAKGLIYRIAKTAYFRREQFVLMGFGNHKVETLLGLRRAPKAIGAFLNNISAAGGTPLTQALCEAEAYQEQQLRKNHQVKFINTVVTDGRVSGLNFSGKLQGEVTVFDVEQSIVKRGRARQLAELLSGRYEPLPS